MKEQESLACSCSCSCSPSVLLGVEIGVGGVRDEARKIVRNWAVGTWWARIGSMDQSQGLSQG